ncbi:MAG: hypothetical protein P8R54_17000 [Myxococcota bacterium]|nr:hypothetical protein [Myxococcota bacterium]
MPSRSATTTETLAAIAAEVPCVLIGTAALRRLHPIALASYTRARTDCDYLLRPAALLPFVGVVQSMGFSVSAWGEPWQPRWRLEDVTGRFYVRAVRGPLTLDATFECPLIDVDAAHAQARWIDGVPIAPEPMLWRLKWIKDAAACEAFAAAHGLTIPEEARLG